MCSFSVLDEAKLKERSFKMNILKMRKGQAEFALILLVLIFVVGIVVGLMFGLPKYNVWSSELQGKAELVRAEQNRQIKIEEAKANLEAEKLNALAEIERAKGAASAIEIENGKLTETYIRYLWVRQQSDLNDKTIIYIPTEGGLPILESTRAIVQ